MMPTAGSAFNDRGECPRLEREEFTGVLLPADRFWWLDRYLRMNFPAMPMMSSSGLPSPSRSSIEPIPPPLCSAEV